ncbi:MAG: Na+/H+ antiporter NhaC family protein [Rikenellaceae bacterium]
MYKQPKPSLLALLPLGLFFALYLVVSIVVGDFYKMPITVAFVVASAVAVAMCKGVPFSQRITNFSKGAAEKNIMLMVWIFILAGAFAASARAMGAVDATVNLTLDLLPSNMLLIGIFVAACFISFAVGTSVGTVVALVPIAAGIAPRIGVDVAYITSIIVGGAFFGDNLSFISDTTIAATQSQGCSMSDKFKANIMLVAPAAVLVALLYFFQGGDIHYPTTATDVEWVKVLPYLTVIILAVIGVNVMVVLVVGTILSGVVGLLSGGFDVWGYPQSLGDGIGGMGELIIITMLAGGLLELIRLNGGLEWLIGALTSNVRNKRMAELSIAALVSMANLCTANNTVAIITTGKISKDIAQRFGVDARRSASIMDTFSCFVQGLLPYGAQLLMASALAEVSPIEIIKTLYYPMLIGVFGLLAIAFRVPRKYA